MLKLRGFFKLKCIFQENHILCKNEHGEYFCDYHHAMLFSHGRFA